LNFLKRIFGRGNAFALIFILGLDGMGFSQLKRLSAHMPTLKRILASGAVARLASPLPAQAQVAWASFATGQNPGKHGIFGLIERSPNPFATYIINALELKSPTVWEILSQRHKSMGVMNVPLTYPPKEINGLMVACSLTPFRDLTQAVLPIDMAPRLLEMDYRIEGDNNLALQQPEAFWQDLNLTMQRRFQAARQLLQSEQWSLWQLHDPAIDRLSRFFYHPPDEDCEYKRRIQEVYTNLDVCLAELLSCLPRNCRLLLVSTHGFTQCRATFMLNYWLEENGYLLFSQNRRNLENMHPHTRAYCLAPGRIFINQAGREQMGTVNPGQDSEDLLQEISHRLRALLLPDSREPIVKAVHRKHDIYRGPHLDRAPDLILEAAAGVDLRANLNASRLWPAPFQPGLPDPDDGFVFIQGMKTTASGRAMDIIDLAPTLLHMLDIAPPPGFDGAPQA
jgi:predicted AlkP superfamily phosphohydrolase/phosphomutase